MQIWLTPVHRAPAWRAGRPYAMVLAMLVASTAAASAGTDFGARLLLVEKDDRIALFLPESHIGSPAQNDRYFRHVIRPAFAASSALLAERSNVSWLDETYFEAACPVESEAEAALDPALNTALRQHPPQVPPDLLPALRAMSPIDSIDRLGRFMRFYALFVNLHRRDSGAKLNTAGARSFKVRNAQSGVLLALAPHRAYSVEDTGTFMHAYCALQPTQRASLITDTITQSAQPDPDDASKSATALRTAAYQKIDAEYRQVLTDLRAAFPAPFSAGPIAAPPPVAENTNYLRTWTPAELAVNKFMLSGRSQAWIAELPNVLQRERLPFYALGAAHFADGPYGDGVITLLRNAGYTVSILRNRHELDAALARLPAPAGRPERPLSVHTLTGGCKRDGETYACSWNDKSTSYLLLNAQPTQHQEIWTVCFERESRIGPEKRCVSSERKVGVERATDLAGAAGNSSESSRPLPDR